MTAQKKFLLSAFLFLIISSNCISQDPVPGYVPISGLMSSPYKIFTALNVIGRSTLFIFAPNGEALFYKKMEAHCQDFKLLPDGCISYYSQEVSGYVILDTLLREVNVIRPSGGIGIDFHELRITGEGDYLLFGVEIHEVDMSVIISGGYEKAQVKEMVIQKVDSENNLLFEWKTSDHFNILDTYTNLLTHVIDYVHFNSLEMDTDSTMIVSSRNLRELTKINLNSGEIIWRMGGKNNQFTFRNFGREFSGQHTIRRKNDTVFTIFDNGWLLEPKYSRGIEFTINTDSMLVEKLREFRHAPDIYTDIVGNLQNLDNGNTLIFWGINDLHDIGGQYTEYDPTGEIVYKGKFVNCSAPSYRIEKYCWENKIFEANTDFLDFPVTQVGDSAVLTVVLRNNTREMVIINEIVANHPNFHLEEKNIDIFPEGEYELDVVFKPTHDSTCNDIITLRANSDNWGLAIQIAMTGTGMGSTLVLPQAKSKDFDIYPIPFSEILNYSIKNPLDQLSIVSSSGKIVWRENHPAGSGQVRTNNFPGGIYIVNGLFKDGKSYHRKIIKE